MCSLHKEIQYFKAKHEYQMAHGYVVINVLNDAVNTSLYIAN